MKILALDFSSAQRSVAVLRDGARETAHEVIESGGRATRAVGMIDEALRQAQLDRKEVECLAIGLGPGSYTGIRAAIAVAQGWQLARPVKLLGVSSAECIARLAVTSGVAGPFTVVIDAQRNEFYLADYEIGPDGPRETKALRLANLAQAQSCQENGATLVGPEITTWFPSGQIVFPRAAALAQLAAGRADFVSGEKLEPIYLRETQYVKAPPTRGSTSPA